LGSDCNFKKSLSDIFMGFPEIFSKFEEII